MPWVSKTVRRVFVGELVLWLMKNAGDKDDRSTTNALSLSLPLHSQTQEPRTTTTAPEIDNFTAHVSAKLQRQNQQQTPTSFLVMGTAEPTNSSSPSDTSPRGQIDRGPVRGRCGFLLKIQIETVVGKTRLKGALVGVLPKQESWWEKEAERCVTTIDAGQQMPHAADELTEQVE